jgi:hypothetical protein
MRPSDESGGAGLRASLVTALTLTAALGCLLVRRPVREELIRAPVTLSPAPKLLTAGAPLPADGESVGVCVYPGPGYSVSGRWTVLTPSGREAQVVARAELVGGRVVTLAAPSSTGSRLCVHPRLGGPLEAPVERLRVVASTPIVVRRIVWQSTAR